VYQNVKTDNYAFLEMSSKNYTDLTTQGYTVLPVLSSSEVTASRDRIVSELEEDPCFKDPAVAFEEGMVMGGFGGLASAHSYHMSIVRELRLKVHEVAIGLCPTGMKMEQCPDRLMYRAVGQCPSGESWHRDESPNAEAGSTIYGGWLNLNDHEEFFACVPKTHRTGTSGSSKNFQTIPKEERPKWKALEQKIPIPPGHMIVFYENIIHRVYPGKKRKEYRLFTGLRITNGYNTVDPSLIQRMTSFQAPKIKGGMQPPLYAKQHIACWMERIEQWSHNVKDKYCYQHTVRSGKNKGKTFRIAHRFPIQPGMQYPQYSPLELNILKPHTPAEYKHFRTSELSSLFSSDDEDEQDIIDLCSSDDEEDHEDQEPRHKRKRKHKQQKQPIKKFKHIETDDSDSEDDIIDVW
jgi:hypothetical protein